MARYCLNDQAKEEDNQIISVTITREQNKYKLFYVLSTTHHLAGYLHTPQAKP